MGLYVTVGIPLAWLPTNVPRYGKRVTASGMQLTIGNAAGVMAPFVSIQWLYETIVSVRRADSCVAVSHRRRSKIYQGPRGINGTCSHERNHIWLYDLLLY